MTLRHKDIWIVEGSPLTTEIVKWQTSDKKDVWNYYVYIYEKQTKRFPELWLEDRVTEWGRITHDYLNFPLASVDWHCGITFYQKHGQVVGHRTVQVGCDFNHYWDEGRIYDLEDVAGEAIETANQIARLLNISPKT